MKKLITKNGKLLKNNNHLIRMPSDNPYFIVANLVFEIPFPNATLADMVGIRPIGYVNGHSRGLYSEWRKNESGKIVSQAEEYGLIMSSWEEYLNTWTTDPILNWQDIIPSTLSSGEDIQIPIKFEDIRFDVIDDEIYLLAFPGDFREEKDFNVQNPDYQTASHDGGMSPHGGRPYTYYYWYYSIIAQDQNLSEIDNIDKVTKTDKMIPYHYYDIFNMGDKAFNYYTVTEGDIVTE